MGLYLQWRVLFTRTKYYLVGWPFISQGFTVIKSGGNGIAMQSRAGGCINVHFFTPDVCLL